jgi:uncharacterized protein YacL
MRLVLTIVGLAVGFKFGDILVDLLIQVDGMHWMEHGRIYGLIFISILLGLFGFITAPFVSRRVLVCFSSVDSHLQTVSAVDMVFSIGGLIVGLLIAALLTLPFASLPIIGPFLPVIAAAIFGYLGIRLAGSKRDDLLHIFESAGKLARVTPKAAKLPKGSMPKILDTSVIIDGRILDIYNTGFLEPPLIAPRFVLEELQRIADSSDVIKRNKGRRGLDVMREIQQNAVGGLQVVEQDFNDTPEVDSKLVKLARSMNGKIITNDYNLNKVAELQGVRVLNINELANAVKPVVVPGEEMHVFILKEGKEAGQGVAYLDDGTMIVVEGGRRNIGEEHLVVVTSVLQTAAGRMIFAKIG